MFVWQWTTAKWIIFKFYRIYISHLSSKESKGPNIESWDTPDCIVRVGKSLLLIKIVYDERED